MADAPPFGPAHGFGLYVHWPYCTRICPYCDFNVYAAKDRDNGPLNAALLEDLGRHADLLVGHPALGSVYLGGGTPSLMAPADIAALIETAERRFGLEADAEITLEANPVDISLAAPTSAGPPDGGGSSSGKSKTRARIGLSSGRGSASSPPIAPVGVHVALPD